MLIPCSFIRQIKNFGTCIDFIVVTSTSTTAPSHNVKTVVKLAHGQRWRKINVFLVVLNIANKYRFGGI